MNSTRIEAATGLLAGLALVALGQHVVRRQARSLGLEPATVWLLSLLASAVLARWVATAEGYR